MRGWYHLVRYIYRNYTYAGYHHTHSARIASVLKELAAMTGRSLQDELDQAVEQRRRSVYLDGLKADYAVLQQDPKAKAEFDKEIAPGIVRAMTAWRSRESNPVVRGRMAGGF